MRELAESIERWRDRGDRIALATVVATRRSAPRPVGAKLIVSERGELFGSVSGGCVESDVAVQAAEVIEDGKPRLLTYGISDDQAWNVGLPCGGEIDVFVERFEGELPESSEPAVALTVLEGERAGEKSLVGPDAVEPGRAACSSSTGRRCSQSCSARRRGSWSSERSTPPRSSAAPRRASAGGLPSPTPVPRSRHASGCPAPTSSWSRGRPRRLEQLAPDRDTAVVVLTHEERLDVPALTSALPSEAFYVGAIGSRRTQAKRRERLLEAGLGESELERLAGPAGLDLGAHTPAEMAVSILAEVLAVRAGRSGGRLAESSGPIHSTA